MAHNRKLVLGAVALVKIRLRGDTELLSEVRDEVEQILIASDFFEGAPFSWVGLIIRYGLENRATPTYERINKKHGDLPVSIEVDTRELRSLHRDELKRFFTRATLKVLLDVARQFNRPSVSLELLLTQYNPNRATVPAN